MAMTLSVFYLLGLLSRTIRAQVGVTTPLASKCSAYSSATAIACVNHHAAVMPYPFNRTIATDNSGVANDSFRLTSVPADPSFELVRDATFIVFDEERGAQILGKNPAYEFVFESREDSIHEAPVYVPNLNSIIYSLPHQGIFEQQLINLTTDSPTLRNYTTDPPVYAVNGGKLWKDHIYWAVEGGIPFPNPSNPSEMINQQPGIYRLDSSTNKVTTLLNNYFGVPFNSPNDLWIDSAGDIFFTDSWYGYAINVSSIYPALNPNTYRFRPSTGHVSIIENTLGQPNGIGFAPDGKTAYITDTGITDFTNPPPNGELPKYGFNRFGGRAVYAFDVQQSPVGVYFTNKRPIWLAQEFAEDGFHVSAEGYLIGAAGNGVDVLSPYGELLVRITTPNISVNNIQFAGEGLSDLWIFGGGGIAKVKWNLTGMGDE